MFDEIRFNDAKRGLIISQKQRVHDFQQPPLAKLSTDVHVKQFNHDSQAFFILPHGFSENFVRPRCCTYVRDKSKSTRKRPQCTPVPQKRGLADDPEVNR